MCPDKEKTPEDDSTKQRDNAGPTPETSPVDPTIPYGASVDEDEVRTVAEGEEDESAATIAVPAVHPSRGTGTGGSTPGSTGGGSVPFTPVRDMTAGSLEKVKEKQAAGRTPRAVGHRFANRFEVVDVLGEGGMGKVFRVRDTHIDNREMALKVLRPKYSNNPQFRALFTKEIHAAQNFVSENVVQIRDTGQTSDNQLFLTMDMVDGEDLHELLKREGALLPRHALEIIRQTLLGLHSGHEQGFIHRDIKPSNVMLSAHVPKTDQNPYGVGVQLLDFGIAGIAAEVSGQIAGTPMYMSPEQAQGQRLDPRSDLFTVGVMMFEMLTGTRPFEGKTLDQVVTSILETKLTEMIADLRHLGKPVQKILTKALQKDREKRYQSASEFIQAIEKSKAFRNPTNLPAGTATLMGIAMLAAIGQGAYIFTTRDGTATLRQDLATAKSDLGFARTALNKQANQLRADYEQALGNKESQFNLDKNNLDAQLRAAESDLAASEARANALEAKNTELGLQLNEKGEQSGELYTDKEIKANEVAELRRQLEEVRLIAKEQGERLQQLQNATSPDYNTAEGFDRLVAFLNRRSAGPARTELSALEAKGLLSKRGSDGGPVLHELVAVAELLRDFDASRDKGAADPVLLENAETKLVEASAQLEDFRIASEPWISKAVVLNPTPTRLDDLQKLVESMETTLEQKISALTSATDAELKTILEGSPTQNPERAFQVASLAGPEFLPRVLQRCVGDLTSTYESRGQINLSRLGSLDCLGPWIERFDQPGGTEGLDPNHVASLREFWMARQWYLGTDAERRSLGGALPVPSISAASPESNWRATLAIQTGLFFEDTLPQPQGRSAVYLLTDSQSGSKRWFLEETPPGQSAGSGETEYTTRLRPFAIKQHGITAAPAQERKSSRRGWKYLENNTVLLDLVEKPDNLPVVTWDTLAERDLPNHGSFPSAEEAARFQSEIDASPPLCLVVTDGKYTRWFSPIYGLVRYDDGRIQRDLVYLER